MGNLELTYVIIGVSVVLIALITLIYFCYIHPYEDNQRSQRLKELVKIEQANIKKKEQMERVRKHLKSNDK